MKKIGGKPICSPCSHIAINHLACSSSKLISLTSGEQDFQHSSDAVVVKPRSSLAHRLFPNCISTVILSSPFLNQTNLIFQFEHPLVSAIRPDIRCQCFTILDRQNLCSPCFWHIFLWHGRSCNFSGLWQNEKHAQKYRLENKWTLQDQRQREGKKKNQEILVMLYFIFFACMVFSSLSRSE